MTTRPLPPPIRARQEPARAEWIAQLEPRRWYTTAPAWFGLGIVVVVAGVAATLLLF